MSFSMLADTVQWSGNNFPEIYEWLMNSSISKHIILRVADPGNPGSAIVVIVDSCELKLSMGDWIVKDETGLFYVAKI